MSAQANSRSLSDLLADRPAEAGVRFISSATDERFCSYAELHRRARGVLGALRRRGARRGSEIVLALESPEHFVVTFWACLLGRLVPVPVQPPGNAEQQLKLERIRALLDASHQLIVDRDFDALAAEPSDDEPLERIAPDDVALIQFSSGSTGEPKGVVLTHRNLIAQLRSFAASAGMNERDTFLSWFPLTHDMGLIGWHLMPLFLGANQCLMPTRLFVWRPALWLAKASEHRATVLSTNNFGLKHFLKLFNGSAEWDLSPVRLLVNGAEPISARLCDEFLERMKPHRLRAGAMAPGYGLAEATLAVSIAADGMRTCEVDHGSLGDVTYVDVGPPIEGTSIRVVDEDGRTLPDDHVGSVELIAESLTRGYYKNEDATRALFSPDGWLRTGDLGFLRAGRLVITGRRSEVIIQGGFNYYPQDLERVVEELPELELGKVVACSVADARRQQDLLAIFVYWRKDAESFVPVARAVREHLLRRAGLLADAVVPVSAIPKTTSGKVQRFLLAERFLAGELAEPHAHVGQPLRLSGQAESLSHVIQEEARAVLGIDDVALAQSLFDQGMTSARAVEFQTRLARRLGRTLPVALVFDHPTIDAITRFLNGDESRDAAPREKSEEPIAIIGIGCRFPGGADTPGAFWRLLRDEVDAIVPLPESRDALATSRPRAGFLTEDVAAFDAAFFGISAAEAESIDPQGRVLLEVCWEALEHAGQNIPALAGTEAGVFLGISNSDYSLAHFHSGDLDRIDAYSYTGVAPAVTAGRIAYLLGLQGPAMAVDTACSSSLLAVHLAVQSLLSGESEMAIAAGVNLILAPEGHASLEKTGALSPDGRCKAFSDAADGYGRGEGAGAIVLKRLTDARAAGDPILAVIRGTAVSHDGRSAGLTIPSGPAQTKVIRRALARAGVDPASIDYIEAHGTGTPLGDPIEVQALETVFGGRSEPLPIGSVKTNIGHLESAAGIAGLIKVVLAMTHETIPASLHCASPTKHLAWGELSVRVADRARPWPRGEKPRRAGVSSFGFSGTNVHVVVEESPRATTNRELPTANALPISARTPEALRALAESWKAFAGRDLEDLCYTAIRRGALTHRAVCRFRDRDELLAALDAVAEGRDAAGVQRGRVRPAIANKLAFVYSGQGSQWAGMGRELIETPIMQRCDELIRRFARWSLIEELMAAEPRLARTDVAQPAIFAIQVALTTLFAERGIAPAAVVGHSSGEIAALWASGALQFEDAVRLIVERGRLMQSRAGEGRMAAVCVPASEIKNIEIAAINGPRTTVITGATADVERFLATTRGRMLDVDFAFHSAQMDDAANALAVFARDVRFEEARLPFYSTSRDPFNCRANVREPVRFADAIARMIADGCTHFVEIGPRAVLSGALAECLEETRGGAIPIDEAVIAGADFGDAIAALHCHGYEVDWNLRGNVIDLPTYPWQRQRHWKSGFHPWSRGAASTADLSQLTYDIVEEGGGRLVRPERTATSAPLTFNGTSPADLLDLARTLDGSRPLRVMSPALQAVARVIVNERPELRCRDEYDTARLARVTACATRPLPVRPDGTYLITGGYGALGLVFANLLADRGVRNLILLGRGGPSATAQADIDALRRRGAKVEIARADVADVGALRRAIDTKLAGVIHAAGIVEDATLLSAGRDALQRASAPKANGARNLLALIDHDLDFFVAISTASIVLGTPGQFAYVAANAEMEEIVRARRGAVVLRLGLVAGRGMAAGIDRRDEGIEALTATEAAAALELALRSENTTLTVMRFDAERWARAYPASRGLLSRLATISDEPLPLFDADSIRTELANIIAAVTRGDSSKLDIHQPLQDLGVDSLMTLRIRGAIAERFGARIPITSFWKYPTVFALAEYIAAEYAPPAEDEVVRAELQKKWDMYLAVEER